MTSCKEIVKEMAELEENADGIESCSENYASTNLSSPDGSTGSIENKSMKSSFSELYKAIPLKNQAQRRDELLKLIKLRRNNTFDLARDLPEMFNNGDDFDMDEQSENEPEPMDTVTNTKKRKKRKRYFANQFMLSEWLVEVPSDLEKDWLVKLCPCGARNIVVARRHTTRAYNKFGRCVDIFNSLLPGGSPQSTSYSSVTILDCIFNKQTQSYFVLDVLVWNKHTLDLCESDMRFYFLKMKFDETPHLNRESSRNWKPFHIIDSFPSELSLIEDKLSRPYTVNDNVVPLEGVLFYHRSVWYTPSRTPLVGWLRPFMIPEVLNVPVSEEFLMQKPRNYVSLEHYLASRNKEDMNKEEPMDGVTVEV